MTVRSAKVTDAPVLARLLVDFNQEFDTPVESVEVLTDRFARLLVHPSVIAQLDDDRGFALVTLRPSIWYDGPVGVLDEFYVAPTHRNRGLGSALLASVRRRLLEAGGLELHINVDGGDLDARRFYERHGFVNVEHPEDGPMLCYIGPTRWGPG